MLDTKFWSFNSPPKRFLSLNPVVVISLKLLQLFSNYCCETRLFFGENPLCFVGRFQYYGKRARQIQERMDNCQIRTAPRHTPHGRNNLNPFLSMQKLILTTDRVEWIKWFVSWMVSSPSYYSCPVTTGIWNSAPPKSIHLAEKSRGTWLDTTLYHHVERYCCHFFSIYSSFKSTYFKSIYGNFKTIYSSFKSALVILLRMRNCLRTGVLTIFLRAYSVKSTQNAMFSFHRSFAWWRYVTTKTRMLCQNAFHIQICLLSWE